MYVPNVRDMMAVGRPMMSIVLLHPLSLLNNFMPSLPPHLVLYLPPGWLELNSWIFHKLTSCHMEAWRLMSATWW